MKRKIFRKGATFSFPNGFFYDSDQFAEHRFLASRGVEGGVALKIEVFFVEAIFFPALHEAGVAGGLIQAKADDISPFGTKLLCASIV